MSEYYRQHSACRSTRCLTNISCVVRKPIISNACFLRILSTQVSRYFPQPILSITSMLAASILVQCHSIIKEEKIFRLAITEVWRKSLCSAYIAMYLGKNSLFTASDSESFAQKQRLRKRCRRK